MDHHDIWFLTCVPNLSSLAWIEVCQEPPVLTVILGGHWWFLTGYLEDEVILDIMDRHYIWFLTYVPNFSSLGWIEVCQKSHVLEVIHGGRWRFLTEYLEDGAILDMMDRHDMWFFYLCAKFQLSSMNRSVSRTPVLEVMLGGRWWFLTGDLEDRFILDVLDHHKKRPGT